MASAASTFTTSATRRSSPPEELLALVEAGMTHRDGHRFEEARKIFSTIGDRYPSEPHGEIGLGSVCFSEGRFAAAVDHYRQALKISPCNSYAYALLGEARIFQGEYSAARVSLRRALDIDPKGPYGRLAQRLLVFLESIRDCEDSAVDWQL